jgi:hypothetical protein
MSLKVAKVLATLAMKIYAQKSRNIGCQYINSQNCLAVSERATSGNELKPEQYPDDHVQAEAVAGAKFQPRTEARIQPWRQSSQGLVLGSS